MGITQNKSSTFNRCKDLVRIERYITVRGQYEGFHSYRDAPPVVAFLRQSHRHLFQWKATIEVFDGDRELEFFMVKWAIEREILPFLQLTELGSCEMQAERILEGIVNSYGSDRYYSVVVSEDGESDGQVVWDPSN